MTVAELLFSGETDHHWRRQVSVNEMLYASPSLENVLEQVRPKDVALKETLCKWIHIHENNVRFPKLYVTSDV
jgi:hypothetical protein